MEVQPLDGRVQDVGVDVENHLLDRLPGVTHQHGHAGCRTTDRTHTRVVTRDVARNTRIFVGAGRKLVEDRHQFTGNARGLEELDGLRAGPHRVVGELPGFPRGHRREVFTGWQTVDVVPDLWAGRDTHVVSHRTRRVVTHRLAITHQVRDAVTPERTGDFLERRLEVRLAVERVVVEDRLDHPVTDQPHFAVILLGRVNFTHLRVFFQPPLDEHLTHHPTPELDCVDFSFRVNHRRRNGFTLGLRLRGVDIQPVAQPAAPVIIQHRLDRTGVVTLHVNQLVQRLATHAVALDQETVVRVGTVRCGIQMERVNAGPRRDDLVDHHGFKLSICRGFPHQLRLFLQHRTLHDRGRERHQVVDERSKRLAPPALDHLVFHLLLHSVRGFFRHLAEFDEHFRLDLLDQLVRILTAQGTTRRHLDLHRLLVGLLEHRVTQVRLDVRNRRRVDTPRFLILRAHQRVTQPGRRGSALVRGDHHEDFRPTLRLDVGQHIGVVLPTALPQVLQQALLNGLHFGRPRCLPAFSYVTCQRLHQRSLLT